MSTTEEHNHTEAEDTSGPMLISVVELLTVLWQRRGRLALVTGLGMLLATGIALWMPNMYKSTAQLMPPDLQSLTNSSILRPLDGSGMGVASMAGGLLATRTSGGTVKAILTSQTAQNDIINRFDLLHIYHCKRNIDARNILTRQTIITEDKLSGIISITVIDPDPYRARDLAKAYVDELDKLLNAMSTSSARRERIFLEERLKSIKNDLDTTSRSLSQFSSRNATINPQTQGQVLIEAASKLQAELITAQSELYGLKARYSDDNVRVREARARIVELQSQLRKMGGIGEKEEGANLKANQLYPSIRDLPILGVTYSNLYRQMTMQELIYDTLNRQYELAKVQEAKEIPSVKILDEPGLPEIKSSPHRMIIVVLGVLVSFFVGVAWIVVYKLWEGTDDSYPARAFVVALMRSIRGESATLVN